MKSLAQLSSLAALLAVAAPLRADTPAATPGSNPIVRDMFTADPAALIVGDTVYLYAGRDEAKGKEMFTMKEWLCYSSKDMKTWTAHGAFMKPTDFAWASRDAWAAQTVEKDGKFYFYATVEHGAPIGAKAIGVAVSDSPTGPFVDARGSALITDRMTPSPYYGDDIDPTVFIDDDGTPWLAWGNPTCFLVKLKPNMTELDGPITRVPLPNYTEGPWISKRNGLYYMTYASFAHQGFSERICYATAPGMEGPWTYHGQLTGQAKRSYTIHAAIIDDFKGQSYFFYHNADLTLPDGQTGGLGRRAVRAEYLYYNPDGTIQPIEQTDAGVSGPPSPAPFTGPVKVDYGVTDPRVKVAPITRFFPTSWAGQPALASTDDPFFKTPVAVGFTRDGGVTSIGQTFVPAQDTPLGAISLYAGDGVGTSSAEPLTLALYDLGPADAATAAAETYTAGANLLGGGEGLRIAYAPQGIGELTITFDRSQQGVLKAGHRYAIELQGVRNAPTVFWRRSREDVYAGGAAYRDRKLVTEKNGKTTDFGFALHAAR